jgi:cysteinyl-tRNA synthetase
VQLRLHNTLTRRKEVFQPIDPKRVRLYDCGPTVYQRIHVGNARSFVVFDVLYRLLRHLYGADNVVYVRNITDIDDKIIDQAAKNGEDIRALTERTTADFHTDLAALGCLPPTHEPRATEHVPGMIALIQRLIERGYAYAAEGHVLFSVPSMPAYGRLSGRNREEQIAGARVDVAPYKRDPADFVLWKPSTDAQPGWDSPWGRGRPGWHIECSAMSEHYLGPLPFDIHAGGLDLIFPHHENEIAQSCCAHGIDTMARFWLHNGFLDMHGEKMSKSLGNIVRVPDALALIGGYKPGEVLRLSLLSTHYRKPASFDGEAIVRAIDTLRFLYGTLHNVSPEQTATPDQDFLSVLMDDLNIPEAMAELQKIASKTNSEGSLQMSGVLRASAELLGLLQHDPLLWRRELGAVGRQGSVGSSTPSPTVSNAEIDSLVEERARARRVRDYARSDDIRKRLTDLGIIVEDHPDGATDWRRA